MLSLLWRERCKIYIMKVKNNSTFVKKVSGTRVEPGETVEVPGSEDELPSHVEVVEKSGSSDSDQNTKSESDTKSESEEE